MGKTQDATQPYLMGNAGRIFNIYCDESGHLENERNQVMVLGAIWCPLDKTRETAVHIRELKQKHGIKPNLEAKWTKVSRSQARFYLDLIDYFFGNDDLHFRAVVIPDKSLLDHNGFQQNHDTWYYKMLFTLLSVLLDPDNKYRIYLDIKDTRSAVKMAELQKILANNPLDYSHEIVEWVQNVRSHEVEMMQISDLLMGAISYANRGLSGNEGKEAIVKRVRQRSGYSLTRTTLLREDKLNVFVWRAQEAYA